MMCLQSAIRNELLASFVAALCVALRRHSRLLVRALEFAVAAGFGVSRIVRTRGARNDRKKCRNPRLRVWNGMVRRWDLVGVRQHARLRVDAGDIGRRRDRGVLRVSGAVSGAGAWPRAPVVCQPDVAARAGTARVMDDHRMDARHGIHRISVARRRLCTHRRSIGGMGANAGHVRHHADGSVARRCLEFVDAAQAPLRLGGGVVRDNPWRRMVRPHAVMDGARWLADQRALGASERCAEPEVRARRNCPRTHDALGR